MTDNENENHHQTTNWRSNQRWRRRYVGWSFQRDYSPLANVQPVSNPISAAVNGFCKKLQIQPSCNSADNSRQNAKTPCILGDGRQIAAEILPIFQKITEKAEKIKKNRFFGDFFCCVGLQIHYSSVY